MSGSGRERCKDLVGKRVELTRDIVTVGGDRYERGAIFTVASTHRGRFALQGGPRQVERSSFKVTQEACTCDNGRVYLTEQAIVDELRAKRGTGEPVSFSFGPRASWRPCTHCDEGRAEAERRR